MRARACLCVSARGHAYYAFYRVCLFSFVCKLRCTHSKVITYFVMLTEFSKRSQSSRGTSKSDSVKPGSRDIVLVCATQVQSRVVKRVLQV